MRIKSYVDGGHAGQGIFTSQGASLTGPLILAGDPVEEMEAASKDYVDQNNQDLISQGVAAEGFVSGGVAPAVLPAFSGDVSNVQGSNVFNLPVSGVVPGTYPKVEVDAKGLVVSGSELVEDDIPSLPWGKITSGRPTSVSGLGIGDLLSREGGELTGGIEAHAHPVNEKNPSTVGYVRVKAEVFPSIYKVGDVVSKPTDVTSFGFLKCNGGLVSKEMYADLYAVVGDRFKPLKIVGSGKPWKQQYDINTVGDSLGTWTTGTSLPEVFSDSQAIVTSNRVYLLGGYTGGRVSTVYTAPINEDGTLGAWTTATSLPGVLIASQAIVTSNRVYLLGGNNGGSNYDVSTVYTAPINEDGTIGAWTTATNLPEVLGISQAIVTSNRVYLLGGRSTGNVWVSTVYTAPINEDGTLGVWTAGTSLPEALGGSQVIVTSNRVYLLGGRTNGSYVSTVYTAPINEDGTLGAWTTGTSLPGALGHSQVIVTSNRVYLLGGRTSGSEVSTVYTAPINEDGTLGAWTTATSLPEVLGISQAIVTSNRVYLLGGYNGSAVSAVYTATFSGGKNDYSEYYDGTTYQQDIPEGMFYLPREENNIGKDIYNYIKY